MSSKIIFFMNIKMPAIVILKFMSRINFMLNSVEHGKSFLTLDCDKLRTWEKTLSDKPCCKT